MKVAIATFFISLAFFWWGRWQGIEYQKIREQHAIPFDVQVIDVPRGEGICDNWKPGDSYARMQGTPPSETGTGRWRINWYECVQQTNAT